MSTKDTLSAASDIFLQLAALATAIVRLAADRADIAELAKLLSYVAADWANTTDCATERTEIPPSTPPKVRLDAYRAESGQWSGVIRRQGEELGRIAGCKSMAEVEEAAADQGYDVQSVTLREAAAHANKLDDEQPETDPEPTRDDKFGVHRQLPHDILSDRLYQARGLSMLMYGEGAEFVRMLRSDLREGVCWTLASLIDDAFVANRKIEEVGHVG